MPLVNWKRKKNANTLQVQKCSKALMLGKKYLKPTLIKGHGLLAGFLVSSPWEISDRINYSIYDFNEKCIVLFYDFL